ATATSGATSPWKCSAGSTPILTSLLSPPGWSRSRAAAPVRRRCEPAFTQAQLIRASASFIDSDTLGSVEAPMARWTLTLAVAFVCGVPHVVAGQSLADLRKLYDAGQYQQVIATARSADDPHIVYLVAQSHQKLSHQDDARKAYERLSGRP